YAACEKREKPGFAQRDFNPLGARVGTDAARPRNSCNSLGCTLDRPHIPGQSLVDQRLCLIDHGGLERNAGLFLDSDEDVLEGEAGIGFGQFLRGDFISCCGDELGFDTRGYDFRIDEDAVAIENNEIWLGHDVSATGGQTGAAYIIGACTATPCVASLNLYAKR